MPRMTPKLSRAVAAVAKLPKARQDALADLLLEAAGRATRDEAALELGTLLAAAEASGPGERSLPDLLAAARTEARARGLLGDE